MYGYHIGPIDFGWENMQTVAATAAKLGAIKAEFAARGIQSTDPYTDVDDFLADWSLAQERARAAGWEGDFRQDPVVFWIPHEDSFKYGFVIKQDNNGSTFVMSPVHLPWLA